MCYPKPGPRCSNHAYNAMKQAYDNYEQEPDRSTQKYDLYRKFQESQMEFYGTPKGQDWLNEQIAETGDQTGALSVTLQYAVSRREEALATLKAAQKQESVSHESHQTLNNATSHQKTLEDARRVMTARSKSLKIAKVQHAKLQDELEYVENVNPDAQKIEDVRHRYVESEKALATAQSTFEMSVKDVEVLDTE